jgi:magnesium-protoporphyrin IX monomethyl ester (oxidative) cyclase
MKIALVCLNRTAGDPHLGIAYIASYLRKYGGFKNIVIVDKEDPLKRIEKEKPDVVGISVMTPEFPMANILVEQIKTEFDIPVIIGGHHISYLPQHLAPSNFDVGVIGEGEQTMLELMLLFEKHGGLQPKKMRSIKGIVFRNERKSNEVTPFREFIEPLDKIPFPARDLLKMEDYYLTPRRSVFMDKLGRYTSMITSRGCIYKCNFCSSSFFWKRFRCFSAKYVVDEIKHLIEQYKVDGLLFYDDLFIANKIRVREIVNLIKKEKINEQIEFGVLARTNLVDDEILKLLKEMNVTFLSFGFESGSEKILKWLKAGSVTVKDNWRALRLSKKYGFKIMSGFIIGSPGETKEDMMKTLELMEDPDLDIPLFGQLTPYPNTPVWEIAKKMGLVSEDIDFDFSKLSLAGYRPDLIMTKEMSEKEFEKIYNMFEDVSRRKLQRKVKIPYKYLLSPRFIKKVIVHWRDVIEYLKFVR